MFFDEILKGLKTSKTFAPFCHEVIGFEAVCVEGKFEIDFFSSVKIVLSFKKQKLFVFGRNLEIKNMTDGQMLIAGQIFCTSNQEVNFG